MGITKLSLGEMRTEKKYQPENHQWQRQQSRKYSLSVFMPEIDGQTESPALWNKNPAVFATAVGKS